MNAGNGNYFTDSDLTGVRLYDAEAQQETNVIPLDADFEINTGTSIVDFSYAPSDVAFLGSGEVVVASALAGIFNCSSLTVGFPPSGVPLSDLPNIQSGESGFPNPCGIGPAPLPNGLLDLVPTNGSGQTLVATNLGGLALPRGSGCNVKLSVNLDPHVVYPSHLNFVNVQFVNGVPTPVTETVPDALTQVDVSASIPVGQSATVTVTAAPVENSGGHSHDDNRPAGVFYLDLAGTEPLGTTVKKTLTGMAEPSHFTIYYKPSAFGGTETIKVSTGCAVASADLAVGFFLPHPNGLIDLLEDFSASASGLNFLTITGDGPTESATTATGTCSHPNRHPQRHFIYTKAGRNLRFTLQRFYMDTGPVEGGIAIGVNDMSLPRGGIFDVCQDWEPPHFFHRMGLSVNLDNPGLSDYELHTLDRDMLHEGFVRKKETTGVLEYDFIPSLATQPSPAIPIPPAPIQPPPTYSPI